MSGFDLSTAGEVLVREDAGRTIHLKDEAGEPMYFGDNEPVTVKVVGTYSNRYRNLYEVKRQNASQGRGGDPEDGAIDIIAQCVLEWAGFYDGGVPLECTRSNVFKVLKGFVWIRFQIELAMEDHAAFSRASQTS